MMRMLQRLRVTLASTGPNQVPITRPQEVEMSANSKLAGNKSVPFSVTASHCNLHLDLSKEKITQQMSLHLRELIVITDTWPYYSVGTPWTSIRGDVRVPPAHHGLATVGKSHTSPTVNRHHVPRLEKSLESILGTHTYTRDVHTLHTSRPSGQGLR